MSSGHRFYADSKLVIFGHQTNWRLPLLAAASIFIFAIGPASAQQAASSSQPAYLNPSLPIDQRVNDLVSRMTIEEKASQMVNTSAAIPRLQVPAYNWWSEALHGILTPDVTVFPQVIGLGATFQTAAHQGHGSRHQHRSARPLPSGAARRKRPNHRPRVGLDFWAPNINIFRDPRWGRGQETYGEDPFLTGRMGVAFVTGMQGDDPKYFRAIATPKHFAVHSGPEPTRHQADVKVLAAR